MKYAAVFLLLAVVLAWQAAKSPAWYGWALAWASLSCLAVSAAYAGLGPGLFGKRPDGRIAWWSRVLLGPYRAAYAALWHLVRLVVREPAGHLVAPGLYLGRRPLPADLPAGIACVVDLCVEFPGVSAAGNRRYVALPTLDAGLSEDEAFRRLVAEVTAGAGAVYVHCASGHGRGAAFAAAVLIARGLTSDVEEAERRLRAVMPGVRLSRPQRELVRRTVAVAAPPSETPRRVADAPGL